MRTIIIITGLMLFSTLCYAQNSLDVLANEMKHFREELKELKEDFKEGQEKIITNTGDTRDKVLLLKKDVDVIRIDVDKNCEDIQKISKGSGFVGPVQKNIIPDEVENIIWLTLVSGLLSALGYKIGNRRGKNGNSKEVK